MVRRSSSSQPLSIWVNGELVGYWTPALHRPTELRYADSWLQSANARPLSLSLPLPLVGNEPLRGEQVENYFEKHDIVPDIIMESASTEAIMRGKVLSCSKT